jgi:hypothetical protein
MAMKVKDLDTMEGRFKQIGKSVWAKDVFLNERSLEELAREDRLAPVLVRCGGGRFTCPAQDAKHFIRIVTEHGGDYVRDVQRTKVKVIVPHSIDCKGV